MRTYRIFTLQNRFFSIILPNNSLNGPFKHIMKKTQNTILKISLINILSRRKWFLTIKTLDKTFQFLFSWIFLKIRKNHFHFLIFNRLILWSKRWITITLTLIFINYDRLCPYSHILISGIVDISMKIIRSTTKNTFFIKSCQFFKKIAT